VDNVASGAVKVLAALSDVTAAVGTFPASDTVNYGVPWIFNTDILVTMEGTSAVIGTNAMAIVCSDAGGWGEPMPLTTPRYNRLQVDFWVDPLRDSSHNITETAGATIQRGKQLFTLVNLHLHRTNPDMQLWGDLRTVGCQLLTEPQFLGVTDAEMGGVPVQKGTAYYGVSVFGATDVVT
jgi:hypothetical protein